MHWLSILFFLIVTLLTGTLVDLFVKNWQADWLEKLFMRFGIGLAALSVEGVVLNLLHIPLDYRVFLAVGGVILGGALLRNKSLRTFDAGKIRSALTNGWRDKSFWYALFVLILFAVTVRMYLTGAFSYDYFEDTDPWRYTVVADYIGEHRTFTAPYYSIQYSEPYTQGYQIVMGVLSQTNDSIYWTMKFFSCLVISFGVPFMYYFARRFSRNEEVAVLAAFFLFAVPAWVTHFIFSLHYNMTIFLVLLYVLAQLMHGGGESALSRREVVAANAAGSENASPAGKEQAKDFSLGGVEGWMYVGIVVYGSMLINHFSTVAHGTIFCFVAITTRILAEKRIDWKTILIFLGGFLLSLLFYIPAYARHWWLTLNPHIVGGIGGVEKLFPLMRFIVTPPGIAAVALVASTIVAVYFSRSHWQPPLERWLAVNNRGLILWCSGLALVLVALVQPHKILYVLGTDDNWITYPFGVYFYASAQNRYHIPVGLGIILMSAVISSFLLAMSRIIKLFKAENAWIAVSLSWIITAFLLVEGKSLSIAIIPFRSWLFLGLFASLFGAWGIVAFIRSFSENYLVLLGAMALLVIIEIPFSFLPKQELNTMVWRDSKIGAPQSRALFAWMRDGGIPKNSVVAHLCGDSEFLSSYDMDPPVWNETFHPKYRNGAPYFIAHPLKLTRQAYSVLKNANVQYVTVGTSCLWQVYGKKEQQSMQVLLPEAMASYLGDDRLQLVKTTDYEFLFKLK